MAAPAGPDTVIIAMELRGNPSAGRCLSPLRASITVRVELAFERVPGRLLNEALALLEGGDTVGHSG